MSFLSWLRNQTSIRSSRNRTECRPTTRRFRPRLETLEDRSLPSTLTVLNNLDDGSAGSLRAEIAAAQSGDTIAFDKSLKGKTIALKGTLGIDKSLDIEGLGAKYLAISGGSQFRVFEVASNAQVTLSGMTIENGHAVVANNGGSDFIDHTGGGILNFGTLTISGCTVTGNSASFSGGGIANALGGTMTITGCTVSRNSCAIDQRGGGGIYNGGAMTLSGSTVTQNIGGGIFNDSDGELTILSSIVQKNRYGGDLNNLGTWSADSSSTIG